MLLLSSKPSTHDHRRLFVAWLLVLLSTFVGVVVWGTVRTGRAEEPPPAKPRPTRGFLIRLEGPITPLTEHFVTSKLARAQAAGADLVVIEIDSPGGMLEPSLQIAVRLRDIAWARTVAWIPREALSGAAIAALGCDEIIMHPQAKIGDAGPIYLNEARMFERVPEKIRTHLVRHVRDLAEAKGRPPALAEAMVDKDLVVFRARHRESEKIAYRSASELESDPHPEAWERLEPVLESQGENFLEVSGARAVELQLAQACVADRQELRKHFDLPNDWTALEPSFTDTAVYLLNRPFITALLLIVALIAMYIELSSPGIGAGGIVSALCFALFFWSRFLGGTSGWLEVILFLTGVALLLVEIFVTPGIGVPGILGVVLVAASLLLASQNFVVPRTNEQLSVFTQSMVVMVGSLAVFVFTAAVLSRHLGSMPVFSRLVLTSPAAADDDLSEKEPARHYADEHAALVGVGDWGVADTPLRPAGKARFGEQLVDVVADGAFIDRGRQVRVVDRQGNRIVVVEVP